ncbi:SRPBCC family protein [Haloferula chungangensis]|uniref:SRPBCC family protein n=1 Tax=Haloferula chungangensis TaxID=1048331 RepID=A0ABW2L3D6_9BACT
MKKGETGHQMEVMKAPLRVATSAELDFSANAVWKLIAGFDTLPDYHASITTSELLEGGTVRKIGLTEDAGGGYVVERLVYFNDETKEFSYKITELIDCDFPLRNYQAFVRVEDLGEGKCRLNWGSKFTVEGASDEEGDALAKAIYQGCFDGVTKVLSKK